MDILYAEGSDRKYVQLPEETLKDLAIDEIVHHFSTIQEEKSILKNVMGQLPENTEDILFRQQILMDLMKYPELQKELYSSLTNIRTMRDFFGARKALADKDNALYSLLSDLRTLSLYVNTTKFLYETLSKYDISSDGLMRLRKELKAITETEEFKLAGEDIDTMLNDLSTVQSAVIGVNFTSDLTIDEVVAVEFRPYPTRSRYRFSNIAAAISTITVSGQGAQHVGMAQVKSMKYNDPVLIALAPKLEKQFKGHISAMKQIMIKYTKLDAHFITDMYEGLIFYLASARFASYLKDHGYEYCMPQIENTDVHYLEIRDFYNLRLAIRGAKEIVKNDFTFKEEERLFILTGPNRGGKTILEQGLGLISLMASIGLFVTAGSCKGMPFRNILTHFPIDENLTMNYGRLGEEAKRVRDILQDTDDRTLVLFNETYSTTSSTDGLYLSLDLLHILKEKGAAVIFNTHIHDLAKNTETMNAWEGKSQVVSLVMEIINNVNTFKVKRSAPDTTSYARNIALKYGITYEQMKESSEST